MTIPSRPAPPPPNPNKSHNKQSAPSRYTPTTNWDDTPFETTPTTTKIPLQNRSKINEPNKKVPPPRPPPPRPVANPLLKKPGSQQSVNILSNLFGRRTKTPTTTNILPPPPSQKTVRNNYGSTNSGPKLPPPPKSSSFSSLSTSSSAYSSLAGTPDAQLISFDSPPSSPTLTQKSNSDCVSVDSFSSESNYSPHNGSISQAESGFEDDFVVDNHNSKDPWETDPFSKSATNGKPIIPHKPMNISAASYYAYTTGLEKSQHEDPLCNGKTLVTQQPVFKPTIIRPNIPASNTSSGKNSPVPIGFDKIMMKDVFTTRPSSSLAKTEIPHEVIEEDAPPSPPMPSCPPPPPPAEYFEEVVSTESGHFQSSCDNGNESYGISVYDFEATQDEDLSFRVSYNIYYLS